MFAGKDVATVVVVPILGTTCEVAFATGTSLVVRGAKRFGVVTT